MTLHSAATPPDVSVVIPVFNKLDLTRACVASIEAQTADASFEILVVDNGSTDGTGDWLAGAARDGRLRAVASAENLGFSRGCNLGAAHARGRYLLFLNNDMEVLPGWLDPMVRTLDADPDVGVVGARLLFPDGTVQHAGVAMVDCVDETPPLIGGQHKSYRKPGDDPEVLRPQLLQVVTGACLMIRPEVFAAVDGFDEGYWNGNEDVDLCLKAGEAGWLVVYRPESTVIHYESQSGPERFARVQPNIARFNAVWRGRARPDFINGGGRFSETPDSAIRLYTPPRLLLAERRRTWPTLPEATVIVVPAGGPECRRRALAALEGHTDQRHHLRLLDDGTNADVTAALSGVCARRRLATVVAGAGPTGVNAALATARGDAVAVLAGNAVVTAGWLETQLAALGAHGGTGLAGPRTNVAAPGQAIHGAADDDAGLAAFAAGLAEREGSRSERAHRLAGFCIVLRRSLVERIGGLDGGYRGLDAAAIDLGVRASLAGFRSVVVHGAYVHLPPRAVTPADAPDERADLARLCARWPLAAGREADLQDLRDRGFLPPLHFQPLPPGPGHAPVPPAGWEVGRWLDAGEASFAAGRCAEAVAIFKAAASALPADGRAANNLAVALLHLDPDGRGPALARAILKDVLRRDPGNADAVWNLQELDAVAAG